MNHKTLRDNILNKTFNEKGRGDYYGLVLDVSMKPNIYGKASLAAKKIIKYKKVYEREATLISKTILNG